MKRYEKIVLEAESGITYVVTEGKKGELVIRARALDKIRNETYKKLPTVQPGEYANVLSMYKDKDGNNAVVPPGWTVSGIRKENVIWGKNEGLVIYQIPQEEGKNISWLNLTEKEIIDLQKKYNQFTWCPVEKLKPNGTLDGTHFDKKIGRRNFCKDIFHLKRYHEELTDELVLQIESIERYFGFFFSRYNISKNAKTGKPQSKRQRAAWSSIGFDEAMQVAASIENNEIVKSHLPFGAEYDSVLEWLLETTRTYDEIAVDSRSWGHYFEYDSMYNYELPTGSSWSKESTNNIFDFAGNYNELTQEKYSEDKAWRVVRGGYTNRAKKSDKPVAYREPFYRGHGGRRYTSFRAVLCIKECS